jgi:hypothetical protein
MPLIIADSQPLIEHTEAHAYNSNITAPSMYKVSCNRPTLLFFTHISVPVPTRFGVC